jgi:acyl dehydratase
MATVGGPAEAPVTAETPLQEGETVSYTRTFTQADVSSFASLSNDEGAHHIESNEDGQVVVHGLLTATLPTKLGGDINFVARTMEFEFPRPAHTGVEITCETAYESVEERDNYVALTASFECETAEGDVVLRGQSEGIVKR